MTNFKVNGKPVGVTNAPVSAPASAQAAPAAIKAPITAPAAPTASAAPAQAPVEEPLKIGKQTVDEASSNTMQKIMQGNTKQLLSKMSGQKLVQAAQQITGMTIFDDANGKFRVPVSGDEPKEISRKKIESLIFDAVNEKQLTLQ